MAIIDELNNLGDAVRERSGLTEKMTMSQMADVVRNIPQPDLSPYATIEYVDERMADVSVNEADLFIQKASDKIIFEEPVDNATIVAGVNTLYEFVPDIPLDEFHAFMNQILSNPQPLKITIRLGQEDVIINAAPAVMNQMELPNGKYYNAILDFTAALDPNLGFTQLYIGAINQKYDLIIISDGTAVEPITFVSMALSGSGGGAPSLAHYWISNDNQFRRYNDGSALYLEINEGYINGLIENRLSMIGTAEAGVY